MKVTPRKLGSMIKKPWALFGALLTLAVAAGAIIVTVTQHDGSGSSSDSSASPSVSPNASQTDLHAPVEIGTFGDTELSKEEGIPSTSDQALEMQDGVVYGAVHTDQMVHVTAYTVDGTVKWTQDIEAGDIIGSVKLAVQPTGLMVNVFYQEHIQDTLSVLDPASGEILLEAYGDTTFVLGDRLLTYQEEGDVETGYVLATGEQAWRINDDGGRAHMVAQQTSETLALPSDDAEGAQALFEVADNPDPDQYIVQAVNYSGALTVLRLAGGEVLAEGQVGENTSRVLAFEDTIFVYRQTARELKAYAHDNLAEPNWSVQAPAGNDGSGLAICGETALCLTTLSDSGKKIQAVDMGTGEVRWETSDYSPEGALRAAGDWIAVSSEAGGTTLLDSDDGTVAHEFAKERIVLPGNGLVVGLSADDELTAIGQGLDAPLSLGPVPSEAFVDGGCEWDEEFIACADQSAYTVWRYRG